MRQRIARIILALTAVLFIACSKEDDNPYSHPSSSETKSPFPELSITTKYYTAIQSKDTWKEDASISYKDINEKETDYGKTSIKGRGNTTWSYPKKPYALKLDDKKKLAGLPEGKRFDLLADYIDRTHMRNSVSLEIAKKAKALEWTPDGTYVNLTLNGKGMGLYFLCEHIKIANNRLDLKEGGYILELDTYYDEDFKFKSKFLGLPVQLKDPDPDEMKEEDLKGIEEYFNAAEDSVVNGGNWRAVIDEDSFVDWWIVLELAQCGEPGHPKSCYMHRDFNGKLKAGPVWDFDWGTFRSGSEVTAFRCKNSIWYGYLFKDKGFVEKVKERWNASKNDYLSVTTFIDETASEIRKAVAADNIIWPMTTTVNKDESMSFDEAVSTLKSNFKQHWMWMDKQIGEM